MFIASSQKSCPNWDWKQRIDDQIDVEEGFGIGGMGRFTSTVDAGEYRLDWVSPRRARGRTTGR